MMATLIYNPLSLKDMAIRRLAAVLFKEPNILEIISNFHCKFSLKAWRAFIEDKLTDEISKVVLPESLKELLIDTCKIMGRQVGRWKEFHAKYLYDSPGEEFHFDVSILEKLCWTTAGAVDYRETAEELVRSDVISIVKRYKLSCLYCMEDHILMFWNELPGESKKYFYRNGRHLQDGGRGMEFWWPYIIEEQESKLYDLTRSYRRNRITFHQYAFQCSAGKGNKTAAEYFFEKLTSEEKESSLTSTTRGLIEFPYTLRNFRKDEFPKEKFSELLSYLLSVMAPGQQMLIFQELPGQVLQGFLEWPFQDVFSSIADLIWEFLPVREYDFMLSSIYRQFKDSGHYYLKLFKEFFLRFRPDFWRSFLDQQSDPFSYFDQILREHDVKAIEMFLRNVDAAARARLVLSEPAEEAYHKCIKGDKWDVVKVCLREASLSQEDKKRLKEIFMRYLSYFEVGTMALKTRKWSGYSRFFDLLDETNDTNKRCSADKTPSKAKKRKSEP